MSVDPASERYARQRVLPGFGPAAQAKLARARILVIGAGGLGSAVIPALAAAGVGTIGIIDDDRVEESNLARQLIHGAADVGSAKVASAAATVAGLDPATVVEQHDSRLSSANALELFDRYDLVIDGSDNFPTRYLANDAAVLTGIPLVWGAVAQYGGQAGVSWASVGPTYRDLFPVPPAPDSVESCEVGGVLPTVCAVIGAILATEAIKIVTGVGTPLVGRVITFDALSGGFRELAYERDPTALPITGLVDYEALCGLAPLAESITAAELASRLGDAPVLLDVRESWEAEIAQLPGALLIPLASLGGAIDQLDPHAAVVVYCHHGIRSRSALALLRARGFDHAQHLDGGIDAWAREIDPTMARY
jgi:molybdopterin/thiamine biosynthesis adenylyltransferase/rhodanese-related sulfurtransferase